MFLKGQSKIRGLVKQVAETAVASSDPDTEGELTYLEQSVSYNRMVSGTNIQPQLRTFWQNKMCNT